MTDIYFLTSNKAKFSHLKFLLTNYDIQLRPPVDYGKPYEEPRIFDRTELLKRSVQDALRRQDKNKTTKQESYTDRIFLIEDTSVRVNALSTNKNEVPGVDVKYWMKNLNFNKLDALLKENGNDRTVEVRSDIVLYLPEKYSSSEENIFYFHGISSGKIVDHEFDIETNLFYPWLDSKTFNKWFCPENESVPLSLLSIENSLPYDFRNKALQPILNMLLSLKIIKKKKSEQKLTPNQKDIFSRDKKIVLNGPTCAGKTVLASHLAVKYGFYHIEASDFMYLEFYQRHGYDSEHNIHDFAKFALDNDPNIVSRGIINFLTKLKNIPIIITGFRSPNEMDWFFEYNDEYSFVLVNADVNIRYKRDIKRKRFDANKSLEDFLNRNELQKNMGLDLFDSDSRFIKIKNEESLKAYFSKFTKATLKDVNLMPFDSNSIQLNRKKKQSIPLEASILISLFLHKKDEYYFSTAEISQLVNKELHEFRYSKNGPITTDKNNVSRYFNQYFHPYYEVKREKSTNKFRLSLTGISQALLYLRGMTPDKH